MPFTDFVVEYFPKLVSGAGMTALMFLASAVLAIVMSLIFGVMRLSKNRWIDGAAGPATGARFEGDNEAKLGPITLKKWTTTSEVTEYQPTSVFEFVAEGYTTWRYEFEAAGDGTRVTESVSHAPYTGWQRFAYETVMRRSTAIVKDMQRTLDRLKAALEA